VLIDRATDEANKGMAEIEVA